MEIEAISPPTQCPKSLDGVAVSAGCVSRQWGRNQGRWLVKMQISPHDFPESRGKRVARGGGAYALQSRQMRDHEGSIKDGSQNPNVPHLQPQLFVHLIAE